MAGLFDFPHETDDDFAPEKLVPLIPAGTTDEGREEILNDIVEAWCSRSDPPRTSSWSMTEGVTLNRVWLYDVPRDEAIDLGDLVREVLKRLREAGLDENEQARRVISLRGCRIDVCDCVELIIRTGFQAFACYFGKEVEFSCSTFGRNVEFSNSIFGSDAHFDGTSFGAEARFVDASLGDRASFHDAEFGANASFIRTTVGDDADFRQAKFASPGYFSDATFGDNADFQFAVFGEMIRFRKATFGKEANFGVTTFGARADLDRATFGAGARFHRAAFAANASFVGAELSGAILHRAILDLADLTDTSGVRFDSNRIHRTIIPGNAKDPWSVLRRNYTGPWFFVHLLFLLIFFTPYIAKSVYLSTLSGTHAFFEERVDELADGLDDLPRLKVRLDEYRERFEAGHDEERAVWVLVGWTENWWSFLMAMVVLAYNAMRAFLTLKVSSLRDAEERSEITPALKEYLYLSKIHTVAWYIAFAAVAFALYNAGSWVWTTKVWVPTG